MANIIYYQSLPLCDITLQPVGVTGTRGGGGGGVLEKRHILSQMIPAATLRACYSYRISFLLPLFF